MFIRKSIQRVDLLNLDNDFQNDMIKRIFGPFTKPCPRPHVGRPRRYPLHPWSIHPSIINLSPQTSPLKL